MKICPNVRDTLHFYHATLHDPTVPKTEISGEANRQKPGYLIFPKIGNFISCRMPRVIVYQFPKRKKIFWNTIKLSKFWNQASFYDYICTDYTCVSIRLSLKMQECTA